MSELTNPLPLMKESFIMEAISRNPGCSWRIVPQDENDPIQVKSAKDATSAIMDSIINKAMGVSNE